MTNGKGSARRPEDKAELDRRWQQIQWAGKEQARERGKALQRAALKYRMSKENRGGNDKPS